MKKIRWGIGLGFFLLISIIMLASAFIEKNGLQYNDTDETLIQKLQQKDQWENPLDETKLVDDKSIYYEDRDGEADNLYVTVLPPRSEQAVSFEKLNNHIIQANMDHSKDEYDPVVEIVFEPNKATGEITLDSVPNATMEIRGQSARLAPQKSYKIKLFNHTDKWLGHKTINLNKHFDDSLRIRNKLSFDYFELLSDFVSLRTRFVKLYIRDLSADATEAEFKYHGLYTFIEQPNKSFLKRHYLDQNGYLYKAEFFEFYRYPETIKRKDDVTYNKQQFEELLEVRGNDNHEALIEMLDAVNDYNRDINEIVDQYFDKDNLLTWLAVDILFDNYDTNSRNFLIYSPVNSDKWFFLPWDYDKGWIGTPYRGKWERGLANYWGMVVFNRFFRDKDNVEALNEKIEELAEIINEENTRKLLDSYYPIVKKNVLVPPDVTYLETTASEFDKEYASIPRMSEENRQYYYESLQNPMPFYLGEPELENGRLKFIWDPSFDLQGEDITYHFMVSKDPRFHNKIITYDHLRKNSCDIEPLKPGAYYWKVTAYDSKGNWQEAFDYDRSSGRTVYGIKRFDIQ